MKLLLLSDRIPPENAGGAEAIAWRFARALRDLGHEVHVGAGTQRAPFEETRDGIPTYHLHSRWPVRLGAYFTLGHPQVTPQLAALYRRVQPDVVGAFNLQNALTWHALTLAKQHGLATAVYLQDAMSVSYVRLSHFVRADQCDYSDDEYRLPPLYTPLRARLSYNPLRNRRIRHILRHHTDVRVSISAALRAALMANGAPDFAVLHPPVEDTLASASPQAVEALRDRLGLRDKRVVLIAGRLNPDKGSVQTLKALDVLRASVPDVRLLVLTRSTAQEQGLDDPRWAGVRPHVVLGGWLEGEMLAAAYQVADVVVTPSVYLDPLISVNPEAMLAGKPVVTTCLGGAREIVEDGVTGFVVNPLHVPALADALRRVLTDPDLAARMGAAGRVRAQRLCDPRTQAEGLASHYAEAVRLNAANTR